MRQRLLADRMVHQGELGVDEAKVVVVVPEGEPGLPDGGHRWKDDLSAPGPPVPPPAYGRGGDAGRAQESRHTVRHSGAFDSPWIGDPDSALPNPPMGPVLAWNGTGYDI